MVKRNHLYLFVMLCISASLLGGCGGGGGSASTATSLSGNSFIGTWTGSWNTTNFMSVQVDNNGKMTGYIANNANGTHGVVSGTLSTEGKVDGRFEYNTTQAYLLGGTVYINGSGHMVGTLPTYYNNAADTVMIINLVKQ